MPRMPKKDERPPPIISVQLRTFIAISSQERHKRMPIGRGISSFQSGVAEPELFRRKFGCQGCKANAPQFGQANLTYSCHYSQERKGFVGLLPCQEARPGRLEIKLDLSKSV